MDIEWVLYLILSVKEEKSGSPSVCTNGVTELGRGVTAAPSLELTDPDLEVYTLLQPSQPLTPTVLTPPYYLTPKGYTLSWDWVHSL